MRQYPCLFLLHDSSKNPRQQRGAEAPLPRTSFYLQAWLSPFPRRQPLRYCAPDPRYSHKRGGTETLTTQSQLTLTTHALPLNGTFNLDREAPAHLSSFHLDVYEYGSLRKKAHTTPPEIVGASSSRAATGQSSLSQAFRGYGQLSPMV